MLPQYKRTTNIGVGIGWIIMIAGTVAHRSGSYALSDCLYIGGAILFLWGCSQYAQGRGYSAYWGALGLLYLIGLVVLVLMPDRHKTTA